MRVVVVEYKGKRDVAPVVGQGVQIEPKHKVTAKIDLAGNAISPTRREKLNTYFAQIGPTIELLQSRIKVTSIHVDVLSEPFEWGLADPIFPKGETVAKLEDGSEIKEYYGPNGWDRSYRVNGREYQSLFDAVITEQSKVS